MKFSIIACFLAATAMAMPAANPYEVADNDIILIQRDLEARGLGSLVKPITKAIKKLKGGPKRPADIVPDLKDHFKVSHDGYGTTYVERWGTRKKPDAITN
ncbi:hypothetical protein CB0940_09655 [Cercospora beticola]|uniref:Uncharacterized protein n=1 Tax=Cercospora beticola TaxID=122368 RepID=A0A2G5HGS4_CERBT|nr:hypothetical protein CB0940_09655 [Cercospora beticola]PIA91737.1 hypothetical protein CB0940_09655 [Cercospora beticola]WPB06007.1 hypothetical protein RHO25_010662 [Cercospora beticola]